MHTNKLISESSPYLLQHAHNPVDWFPWGEAALQKAKDENKLIIISIGYSACHWCHVMEHESFENEGVAEIMNKNFISIKVDREERPDLDAIYMQAVQLITGRGGWPMNVIALPDGKPVYGGTYFRKDQWMSVLNQVNDFYRSNTAKCIEYGNDLATGVKQMQSIVKTENTNEISIDDLNASYDAWKNFFDYKEGGPNRAPKFPMPNNYLFLLRYAHATKNDDCLNYVLLTLKKIAYGGIYDHLAGGFARYSTDGLWKVPHFEKMLYDNAQLISLYSEAFQLTKNNLFKEVVYETFEFIKNELTSNEGSFYSALDADSEGEEGKFYVWKKKEIETILGDDAKLFCEYYNVNQIGFWEHENYILLRKDDDEFVATKNNLSVHELKNKIHLCKEKLLTVRNMRIKPGLDDKQLTSWNALMLKAYTNAFAVFNDKIFLEAALKNAKFIQTKLLDKEFNLFHNYKNGKTTIPGFLEDYAFVIEAWIELYQSTFNEQWLTDANELMQKAIENFFDERAGMFLFHSKSGEELFSHHFEIQDNVIPASNSSIANSLFLLGHYFQNEKYISMSKQMLNHVMPDFKKYGSSYSNWGLLALKFATPFYEVVISGKASLKKLSLFSKFYSPNKLFAGSDSQSTLPLLINRFIENKTLIYVCSNGACQLPVESADETMELITQNVD